jgi:hypothetical protein
MRAPHRLLRFAEILKRGLYICLFGHEPILNSHEEIARDPSPGGNATWRTETLCIGMKAI